MFFLHLDLDQNQYFYTEAPVLPQSRSGHTTQLAPPFKGYIDLLVTKKIEMIQFTNDIYEKVSTNITCPIIISKHEILNFRPNGMVTVGT